MKKRFPIVRQTIFLYCNNIKLYGKGEGGGEASTYLKGIWITDSVWGFATHPTPPEG